MDVRIENSWKDKMREEFEKPYFKALTDFVRNEYRTKQIFPPGAKIFAAFDACPFDKVKVVILGQDPYHDVGQANGLCFSVADNVPMPPSLINIFREIKDDLGTELPKTGNLNHWAQQGVLLLNSTLTVEAHKPGSHQGRGWEEFTDEAILRLNADRDGLVFMLWGSYAIRKGAFIDKSRHLVLTAPHPSPLSAYRGFFGCRHFSKANAWLKEHGQAEIQW